MNSEKSDENAQMMTLEALIAALLIIASVLFVVSQAPSHIQQEGQYSEVQLKHYGEDVIDILKGSPSPVEDYDNLLQYYISKNKYNELDEFLNDTLPDNVGYNVVMYSGDQAQTIVWNGYPTGDTITVSEIITAKSSSFGWVGAPQGVFVAGHDFSNRSLIIPMDDKQNNNMTAYNLVMKIAGLNVPVYQLLQDPRGRGYETDWYWPINTTDDPWGENGTVEERDYAGGPYVVDADDLTPSIRNQIKKWADNPIDGTSTNTTDPDKQVTVHESRQPFTYKYTTFMAAAPRIAVYPEEGPLATYYSDSGVPYTVLNNTDILNGELENYDILTLPHEDITESNMPDDVVKKIIDWVSDGGILHAECASIDTEGDNTGIDDRVEDVDGENHSWYGFIGVIRNNSNGDHCGGDNKPNFIKFIGNTTIADTTGLYNETADPGAPFNPLAQSYTIDGTLPWTGGHTTEFTLRSNHNPDVNIMAVPITHTHGNCGNGCMHGGTTNEYDYPRITYIEAPFDKGTVIYLGGHDQSEAGQQRERLIFNTFMYSVTTKVYAYGLSEIRITLWYK